VILPEYAFNSSPHKESDVETSLYVGFFVEIDAHELSIQIQCNTVESPDIADLPAQSISVIRIRNKTLFQFYF